MGCDLFWGLRSLRDLFSDTSKSKQSFIKMPSQPFVEAAVSVRKALELSGKPELQALATRLETASQTASGHNGYFIYPIPDQGSDLKKNSSSEIYVRESALKDFYAACIFTLKTDMTTKQRDQVWDAVLTNSKILHGDNQDNKGIERDTYASARQELAYEP